MISKCANPACSRTFHSLRRGLLFQFDVRHPREPCRDIPHAIRSKKPCHATVYFWLCERCAQTYTLHFDLHEGLNLVHRQPAVVAAKAPVTSPGGFP